MVIMMREMMIMILSETLRSLESPVGSVEESEDFKRTTSCSPLQTMEK